jgi:hypothetical protein
MNPYEIKTKIKTNKQTKKQSGHQQLMQNENKNIKKEKLWRHDLSGTALV